MKRWQWLLAAAGTLLLLGWGLHKSGWLSASSEEATTGRPSQTRSIDPMDTQSGWRYRQNLPHHWRYIVLQN
jgi:hypothetical protein